MFNILNVSILIASLVGAVPIIAAAESESPADVDRLVQQCAGCHGSDGNSKNEMFPSFGGVGIGYFKYAMETYRSGNRNFAVMKSLAEGLSETEIDQLARHFERQVYQAGEQTVDENLAAQGKVVHEKYCAKCHDNGGRAGGDNYGVLAGQWMSYLRQAFKSYLDGTRKTNVVMQTKLNKVQDEIGAEGFEQLLHYYASEK